MAGGGHFQHANGADKMTFFTMLSLDNLSKSYGGRKILDGVSWSMGDDGRVGLVGLNGAGKSTLLKMIAEVLPLD